MKNLTNKSLRQFGALALLSLCCLTACGGNQPFEIKRSSLFAYSADGSTYGVKDLNGNDIIEDGCSTVLYDQNGTITLTRDAQAYRYSNGQEVKIDSFKQVTPYNGYFALGYKEDKKLYVLDSNYEAVGTQTYQSCSQLFNTAALLVGNDGYYYIQNKSNLEKVDLTSSSYNFSCYYGDQIRYFVFSDSSGKRLVSLDGTIDETIYSSISWFFIGNDSHLLLYSNEGASTDAISLKTLIKTHLGDKELVLASNSSSGSLFWSHSESSYWVFSSSLSKRYVYPATNFLTIRQPCIVDGEFFFLDTSKNEVEKVDASTLAPSPIITGLSEQIELYPADNLIYDRANNKAYDFKGNSLDVSFNVDVSKISFGDIPEYVFYFGNLVYSGDYKIPYDVGFSIGGSASSGDFAVFYSKDFLHFAFYDHSTDSFSKAYDLSFEMSGNVFLYQDIAYFPDKNNTHIVTAYCVNGTKVADSIYLYPTLLADHVYNGVFSIYSYSYLF